MQTNHPTIDVFFVFAFTYCRLRVYEEEVEFARKLLGAAGVEFVEDEKVLKSYQEVDTRLLCHLMSRAFPKVLEAMLPEKSATIKRAMETFSVRPSLGRL